MEQLKRLQQKNGYLWHFRKLKLSCVCSIQSSKEDRFLHVKHKHKKIESWKKVHEKQNDEIKRIFLFSTALVWDWCQESLNTQTTFCDSTSLLSNFPLIFFKQIFLPLLYASLFLFISFQFVWRWLLQQDQTWIKRGKNGTNMERCLEKKMYQKLKKLIFKHAKQKQIPWPSEARNFLFLSTCLLHPLKRRKKSF